MIEACSKRDNRKKIIVYCGSAETHPPLYKHPMKVGLPHPPYRDIGTGRKYSKERKITQSVVFYRSSSPRFRASAVNSVFRLWE
jgi:hypothetical protein